MEVHIERWPCQGRTIMRPAGERIVPIHAGVSLQLAIGRRIVGGCAAATPLGVLVIHRGERRWLRVPLKARGVHGLLAGIAVADDRSQPRAGSRQNFGDEQMTENDAAPLTATEAQRNPPGGARETVGLDEQVLAAFGRVSGIATIADALRAVTRPDAAVGPVTTAAGHTIVPLLETVFYGGFGMGMGSGRSAGQPDERAGASEGGGGGGGGGGIGHSRVVAVVVIGPDGVEVRPIVDATKLGLAALGAGLALAGILRRWRR